MKLGINQPAFLPYIGYFSLIKQTDKWIVFDNVQFIRHGWIERNRILHPDKEKGWQYIKVPLEKFNQKTIIKDVKIQHDGLWQKKILSQIEHYKKIAPYYLKIRRLLEDALNFDSNYISELDTYLLSVCCDYIGINFNYQVFSKINLDIDNVNNPDEWALEICKKLKADEYINAPGGVEFFDRSKYEQNGILIKFLRSNLDEYDQKRTKFEPALSILDVMLFNSPEEIRLLLDSFTFI